MSDRIDLALDAMRSTNQRASEIVRAHKQAMTSAIEALQARTKRLPTRRARRTAAMPPPITRLLHGFSHVIEHRVDAIVELLTPNQRDRLRAIAPGFIRAVLANEPDVVQTVTMLLAVPAEAAAFCITFYLDVLERRFAS